jgi:predicted HTH domain antitoxin
MVKLTIEIPEEAFSALREAPERFASELQFAAAVHWYGEGRISGSKAAQIAGLTRLAFLDELARRKLDVVKIDLDQLRRELQGGRSIRKGAAHSWGCAEDRLSPRELDSPPGTS